MNTECFVKNGLRKNRGGWGNKVMTWKRGVCLPWWEPSPTRAVYGQDDHSKMFVHDVNSLWELSVFC